MKKLLSLTTILACASCLGAYADADAVVAAAKNPGSAGVLSFGGFYGVATKDLWSEIDKVDVFGAMVNYEFPGLITEGKFSLSPFVEGTISYGYYDEKDYYYGVREKDEVTIMHYTAAVGAKGRYQITEKFALTANVKIGADLDYMDLDVKVSGGGYHYHYDKDKTTVGFLYGAGIGGDYQISKRWGVFVGVDYVGSTARPDFDEYGKPDAQAYVNISAGATYRF